MASIPLFKEPKSPAVATRMDVEKAKVRLADMNAKELQEEIAKAEPHTAAYNAFIAKYPQHVDKLKAYWAARNGGKRKTRKGRKGRKHRKTKRRV